MHIFFRPFTDPYLNIAAEEYFVKQSNGDVCMIWINGQSVIIGKHQNAYAEINYPFVNANHIPVIRRISGGGAVYHDRGNINFTFIKKTGKAGPVDFSQFTSIIIKFIQSFGIEVNVNKRNSLYVGKYKFSGHAEHVFHDKVLHHGTLLFETDLETLQQCLNPGTGYKGKAMASVRSEVTNIASLLPERISIHAFAWNMVEWLIKYFPGSTEYQMNIQDMDAITSLAESKYKTWSWNFGYSPAYSFQVNFPIVNKTLPVNIKVENGKFTEFNFPQEYINQHLIRIISSMKGSLHNEEEINKFAKSNVTKLELAGINIVNFSDIFFQ